MNYYDVTGLTLEDAMNLYPFLNPQSFLTSHMIGTTGDQYWIDENGMIVPTLQATDEQAYWTQEGQRQAGFDNMFYNSDLYNPNGTNTNLIQTQAQNTAQDYANTYGVQNNYVSGYNSSLTNTGNAIQTPTVNTNTNTNNNNVDIGPPPVDPNTPIVNVPYQNNNTNNNTVNNPRGIVNAWQEGPNGVNSATFGPSPTRNNRVNTNQPAGVLPVTGNQGGNNGNNQTYMNRVMNGWSV